MANYLKGNYWKDPFFTSMIMGGRVFFPDPKKNPTTKNNKNYQPNFQKKLLPNKRIPSKMFVAKNGPDIFGQVFFGCLSKHVMICQMWVLASFFGGRFGGSSPKLQEISSTQKIQTSLHAHPMDVSPIL